MCGSKEPNVCSFVIVFFFFSLLQFDIGQWLSEGKPSLSECDEFIDSVGRALTAIGPAPAEEKQILHEVFISNNSGQQALIFTILKSILDFIKYMHHIVFQMFCNHLRLVLKHKFPLHFNAVLQLLLKTSESQSLCPDVWYSVINVLLTMGIPQVGPGSSPILKVGPDMNPGRIMEDLRQYAVNQKLLQHHEVRIVQL